MDKDARRAHLILIDQPLLDEWLTVCRAWDGTDTSNRAYIDAIHVWNRVVLERREYGGGGSWTGRGLMDFVMQNGDYYTFVAPNKLTGETK